MHTAGVPMARGGCGCITGNGVSLGTAATSSKGCSRNFFPAPRREHRVFIGGPSHSSHGDRPATPIGWVDAHVVRSSTHQDPRSIASRVREREGPPTSDLHMPISYALADSEHMNAWDSVSGSSLRASPLNERYSVLICPRPPTSPRPRSLPRARDQKCLRG